MISIKGFHTCSQRGGHKSIKQDAPFKSITTEQQWLTQGYYLWTDHNHFAHKWGKDFRYKRYKDGYAIAECEIIIPKNLLLDLTGNVEHQFILKTLIEGFEELMEKGAIHKTPISVAAVIQYYRNKNAFPFKAIKAHDRHGELEFKFFWTLLKKKKAYS
jgi:hypothetical protein